MRIEMRSEIGVIPQSHWAIKSTYTPLKAGETPPDSSFSLFLLVSLLLHKPLNSFYYTPHHKLEARFSINKSKNKELHTIRS